MLFAPNACVTCGCNIRGVLLFREFAAYQANMQCAKRSACMMFIRKKTHRTQELRGKGIRSLLTFSFSVVQVKFVREGGMPPLVSLIRSLEPRVQEQAAVILRNLSVNVQSKVRVCMYVCMQNCVYTIRQKPSLQHPCAPCPSVHVEIEHEIPEIYTCVFLPTFLRLCETSACMSIHMVHGCSFLCAHMEGALKRHSFT